MAIEQAGSLARDDFARANRVRRELAGWLPSTTLIVVLVVLVLPPMVYLLYTSLLVELPGGASQLALTHYATMARDPRLYTGLWNSLVFSVLSTILAIAYGATVAWVVERTNAPWRSLAYFTVVVSLGTPHILHVAAWQFILSRQGPINQLYMYLSGTSELMFNVYSMSGMVFVQGILWAPLVFLLLSAIFRRSNAEMEEVARICGASIFKTVTRISFRLAWPAIVGMSIFVFIRNLESFDVPLLIGYPASISMLTTDIYLSMTRVPPEMGHASAFSISLVLLLGVMFYFYGRYTRSAERFATVTGKGFRPRAFDLGRWRWIGGATVIVNLLLVLIIPLVALAWNSFMPYLRPMRPSALALFTLDNYRIVLEDDRHLSLVINTLIVAAAAATLTMILTTIAGWLVVRRWRGARVIEQLVTAPLVFPGIILGVALVILALRAPFPLYGTLAVIVLAFVIRYMPYGMRYAHGGALQIHRELEEAAGAAGASQWLVLRKIVVPLLLPAIVSGWLFIFLIGANELSMSVLLAGPRSQVMAVAMYELWGNGQGVEVYALGVLWTAFMTLCAIVFYVFARRTGGAISGLD
ncbi:MAG: iron ABC transporter permease [Burkholderiales bacterium]|nr:iron ABC transporter permease [Burkholderiales bacterium]